jgi:hypothetical protein
MHKTNEQSATVRISISSAKSVFISDEWMCFGMNASVHTRTDRLAERELMSDRDTETEVGCCLCGLIK